MNALTLRRRLAAVAVAFAATLVAPGRAGDLSPTIENPESIIALPSDPYLAKGMARDDVAAQMGWPDDMLSPDLWVYWRFRAKHRPAGEKLDTLLVGFQHDRVVVLRLTDRQSVLALLARLRGNASRPAAVAMSSR